MSVPPHPCHKKDCPGTCRYVEDDYGSVGSGGSYEVYQCNCCGHTDYSPMGD